MFELPYESAMYLLQGAMAMGYDPSAMPGAPHGPIPLWKILQQTTGERISISESVAVRLSQTTIYSLECIRIAFGLRLCDVLEWPQ